jgi:hypothetical protein
MVPISLVFFSDVLSRKNVFDVCSMKNYWGVVQMPLIDDFLLFFVERKNCITHACDNFCDMLVYCVEHRKNNKSVVWYFF